MIQNSVFVRLCCLLAIAGCAKAQFYESGLRGSDGALILTTPGTILFDARTFTPPLNSSGDNVYRFTYLYIARDVTVKLSANLLRGPVFWLSEGPVIIDGTIDLDGAEGDRSAAIAGAGGYPGGGVQQTGFAPGDGFSRNMFLVPLVGGSGGNGGQTQGGGAGGGALLIASSAFITVNGTITANGGSSTDGSGGEGGAIRLVAPVIDGSAGLLSATGGQPGGRNGRVRFETSNDRFTGSFNGTPFSQGKPFGLFLPPNPPASVRVLSVEGVASAKGAVAVNQTSRVSMVIEAKYIPPGTEVQLELLLENGKMQVITTTPLEGTFEISHATASIAIPGGLSNAPVKATWKQKQ